MNEENESISFVVAPVYDLMLQNLVVSVTLLQVARANISFSEEMASRCINNVTKNPSQKHPRSLLHSRKSLKVILSEIDKLIKRVECDCEEFYKNSSVANNTID